MNLPWILLFSVWKTTKFAKIKKFEIIKCKKLIFFVQGTMNDFCSLTNQNKNRWMHLCKWKLFWNNFFYQKPTCKLCQIYSEILQDLCHTLLGLYNEHLPNTRCQFSYTFVTNHFLKEIKVQSLHQFWTLMQQKCLHFSKNVIYSRDMRDVTLWFHVLCLADAHYINPTVWGDIIYGYYTTYGCR